MKHHIHQSCSSEFNLPLLDEVIGSLQDEIIGWISIIYGKVYILATCYNDIIHYKIDMLVSKEVL